MSERTQAQKQAVEGIQHVKTDIKSNQAQSMLVDTVAKKLGKEAGELAATACEGISIGQTIALAKLFAAIEHKSKKERTEAANKVKDEEYGFDRDAAKMIYRESRSKWKTKSEAAEEMTTEVNWWRNEFGRNALKIGGGKLYAQSVYDWLDDADKEDGFIWKKGRPRI